MKILLTFLLSFPLLLIAQTCATFTDSRDGEVYTTVQIGNQCWMAENLRYNAPNSMINPLIDSIYPTTFGRHYTWITLMNGEALSNSNPSGVQGICPNGWHVPSDAEWTELEMALGLPAADTAIYGLRGTHAGHMKSTTGWVSGMNGTNTSGFNALPAGYYNSSNNFVDLGSVATFWTSGGLSYLYPTRRTIKVQWDPWVLRDLDYNTNGHQCRCVKSIITSINKSKSFNTKKLRISPNPVDDKVQFDFVLEEPSEVQIMIYNISGHQVFHRSVTASAGEQQVTLDLKAAGFHPGVYFVELRSEKERYFNKLILQ
ncbi:MAG: T9SS type A sorting domain-containing protein [Saprospiraceae bacterium]|nr:T9SS type A sorting domain-containing protein [Saprospiraceae bacterium]